MLNIMKRNRKAELKAWREERKRLGLCLNCGKPNDREGCCCSECKEKMNEKTRNWRRANPIRARKIKNKSYQKNRDKILKHAKLYSKNIWLECIYYYSYGTMECTCCGESILEFLTIDHMYGKGRKQKNSLHRWGRAFYLWLIKNNFPEGYQVLCYNCNCGRAKNNGICPHKRREGVV